MVHWWFPTTVWKFLYAWFRFPTGPAVPRISHGWRTRGSTYHVACPSRRPVRSIIIMCHVCTSYSWDKNIIFCPCDPLRVMNKLFCFLLAFALHRSFSSTLYFIRWVLRWRKMSWKKEGLAWTNFCPVAEAAVVTVKDPVVVQQPPRTTRTTATASDDATQIIRYSWGGSG